MNESRELMERYRSAFARADARALADCFAFPVLVVTVADDGASRLAANADEWPGVLERLLGAHKRLGVTDCAPLAVEITEPLHAVAIVRVHWALRRGDGESIYDFTGVYTLARVEGRLRIVGIAHDELPKMQAALQGS